MQKNRYKYIIIGGGLSGLTSAFQFKLSNETNVKVLEARNVLGGRVHTKSGIDLGATWLHHDHTSIFSLLEHLKLEKYRQFNSGDSFYTAYSGAPVQTFHADPKEVPSYRIKGGTHALIKALAEQLMDWIELETVVEKIIGEGDCLIVKTNKGEFKAEQVIVTVPPRLASTIKFQPNLPNNVLEAMQTTHTWFSHAIKVGLTFDAPFWRNQGKSGMVIGAAGELTELYDHSNEEGTVFSLMGFAHENLRDTNPEEQEKKIVDYIAQFLGEEVLDYQEFFIQDWSKEQFITGEIGIHPQRNTAYGNPVFQKSYLNGKLHFSGTETSRVQGGYLEGAVHRGLSLAQELRSTESKSGDGAAGKAH
jgi:monoamine oxidase